MSEFVFRVSQEVRAVDADRSFRVLSISAAYPTFVYQVPIKKSLSDSERIEHALTDLKLRLVQEILGAKWEFEE